MLNNRIKIKLRSFDHSMLDDSTKVLYGIIKRAGASVVGPIPLPKRVNKVTVNRSPHVNKKARDQFEIRVHTRLIEISYATTEIVNVLKNIDLGAGVDVNIKLAEVL